MKGPARLLVILVLPIVIGKILEVFLSSAPGRKLAEKSGNGMLATEEGIDMARKYGSAGLAAATTAATALMNRASLVPDARPDPKALSFAAIAQDTAELLLATGALVKVAGDFMKDREELKVRKLGGALR